jgi:hypothetical protein|tara:strand:+ start:120 stop:281 length:162 start_codon:yes stop_codon:yes gene_type:complete
MDDLRSLIGLNKVQCGSNVGASYFLPNDWIIVDRYAKSVFDGISQMEYLGWVI